MLLNPLNAALAAVLVLLLLWLLLRRGVFLIAAVSVIALLWLLATPLVSDGLMSLLEGQTPELPAEALPSADAIVVLGGTLSPPATPESDANLSSAADRIVYAARLYALGKAPIVLISGGGGGGDPMQAESVHAAALLSEWGVPESALLTETESINTYENAVYTKLMLDQHDLQKVLLVTSAMHMPRALATFQTAGIDATPAATDFEASGPGPSGLAAWVANPASLDASTRVLKEAVGGLVYRSRGWIGGDG